MILNNFHLITLPICIIIIIVAMLAIFGDNCCMCGATPPTFLLKRNCCPCPNYDYINEVEEYIGYQASSTGSWLDMCQKYKEEMNKTFDCFE